MSREITKEQIKEKDGHIVRERIIKETERIDIAEYRKRLEDAKNNKQKVQEEISRLEDKINQLENHGSQTRQQ